MASTNDIEIKVTVDAQGAIKAFNNMGDELEDWEKLLKKGDKGLSTTQAKLLTLDSALSVASRAFNGLKQVVGTTFEQLERASQLEGLERGFNSLQASIGQNATETFPALQRATMGLVDDQTLLQASNKAVLLGVDKGEGKFDELAAAAISLGRAMGKNAASSIDDVTTALGRGSVLILDNLGVTLKMEEAYTRYSEILGRALTEEDKANAFRVVATEKILQKAEALGKLSDMQLSAGDASIILKNAIKSSNDSFVKGISSSQELGAVLLEMGQTLKQVDWATFGKRLGQVLSVVFKAIDGFSQLASATSLTFDQLKTDRYRGELLAAAKSTDTLTTSVEANVNEMLTYLNVMPKTRENFTKLKSLFIDYTKETKASTQVHEVFRGTYRNIIDQMREYERILPPVIKKQTELNDGTGDGAAAAKKLVDETDTLLKSLESYSKVIDLDLLPKIKDLIEGQVETGTMTDANKEALEKLGKEYIMAGGDATKFKNTLDEGTKALEDLEKASEDAGAEVATLAGVFDTLDTTGLDATIESLENASIKNISGLIKNLGSLGGDLGIINDNELEEINSVMDGFATGGIWGGVIAYAVESIKNMTEFVNKIDDTFENGSGKIVDGALQFQLSAEKGGDAFINNLIETAPIMGRYWKNILVEYQNIASKITGGLSDDLFNFAESAIGRLSGLSNDLGTNERKGFGQWLKNTIEEATGGRGIVLNIEGEATNILDNLDMSKYNDEMEKFNTATAEGRASFEGFLGVGSALNTMFGDLSIGAGQLANILASAVGGELNNLQILLGQMGISQEQFAEVLEQGFLAGDISASQYIKDLDAIKMLYEKGIPGAMGAYDEAFGNLVEDGLISGANLADSLGDLLIEAGEAGIESFDGLREKLIEAGWEVETVDKFFQALAQNGITEMEQLGDLTTEQVGRIGASLESVEFPFLTEASDELDVIKKKLDAIEEDKYVTVHVEYEVQGEEPPGLS